LPESAIVVYTALAVGFAMLFSKGPSGDVPRLPVRSGAAPFGNAIAAIRQSKGLKQKEVVAKISNFYSEESAYRRIESGRRTPDREAAIAIVTDGLGLSDTRQINSLIGLLGYGPLSADERQHLSLAPPIEGPSTPAPGKPSIDSRKSRARYPRSRAAVVGLVFISLALSAAVVWTRGGSWIWIATGVLYAALYAESLFLETAYAPDRAGVVLAATIVFSFMLLTSVIALAIASLLASLAVFVSAAVTQWIAVRPILPEAAIVPTRFQSHTAQSAHLKNTLYFLFIVVFFWLPPMRCVSALRQQVSLGHDAVVRDLLSSWLVVTPDAVCLNSKAMWIAFALLIPVVMGLGAHLLENLRGSQRLNRYTTLCYIRAGLYLCLCLLCTLWYSHAVAQLLT
jgi:transcriptional regulator with XRE-family HTH domain